MFAPYGKALAFGLTNKLTKVFQYFALPLGYRPINAWGLPAAPASHPFAPASERIL
jgi:hypothetical protein